MMLFKLGRPKDAVDSYEQALAINPHHEKIHEYRKRFLTKADKYEFETLIVNQVGQGVDRKKGEAQFFIEDLGNDVSMEMVAIPGGKTWIGSPKNQG